MHFAPVWDELEQGPELRELKVEVRKFTRKQGVQFPPCIEEYALWYPNLILVPYPNWVEAIEKGAGTEGKRLDGVVFNRDPNDPRKVIENENKRRPYTKDGVLQWIRENLSSSYFVSRLPQTSGTETRPKRQYTPGAAESVVYRRPELTRSSFPKGTPMTE